MKRNVLSAAIYSIALLSTAPTVQAEFSLQSPVSSPAFGSSTGGSSNRYLSVSATAFHSTGGHPVGLGINEVDSFRGMNPEGGDYLIGAYIPDDQRISNRSALVAPVQLPDKAVVKTMTCFLYDEEPDRDIMCQLRKIRHEDGKFFSVAYARTEAGDYGAVRVMDSADDEVNNLEYAYTLWVEPAEYSMCWPSDPTMGVKSVVLRYQTGE